MARLFSPSFASAAPRSILGPHRDGGSYYIMMRQQTPAPRSVSLQLHRFRPSHKRSCRAARHGEREGERTTQAAADNDDDDSH